ncbi:DUF3826 domain-containing protein [Ferruginibacter sp.]
MKRFRLVNENGLFAGDIQPVLSFSSIIHSGFLNMRFLSFIALLFWGINTHAQSATDTAYQRVIAERTAKIVNTLNLTDAAVYKKVQQQLADQYFNLNDIQDKSKAVVTGIKAKGLSKEETDAAVKEEENKKSAALKQLHANFIAQLKEHLSEDQIVKIKDGMTYNILPVTWTAYLDMLQHLTKEQKDQMYAWLVEARELAMDEGFER